MKNLRGQIFDRSRSRQIIDFSGLRYGKITPTDIDGLIEFRNKYFILIELKLHNAQMPRGQEIAFVRMVLNLKKANKPSVLFIASHDVEDPEDDIDASKAIVTKLYHPADGIAPARRWMQFNNKKSLRDAIDLFIDTREKAK